MAQMVEKKSYTNDYTDCLLAPHLAFEVGVKITNTNVTANADGKKIIPAGTPIGGDTSALTTRTATLQVTNSASLGSKTQGILRYPVDVTSGSANATMIIRGVVDSSKCPSLDSTVAAAIPLIQFVKGVN